MPIYGGILGFFAFFALIDISLEMTKIRKLLERQEEARLASGNAE